MRGKYEICTEPDLPKFDLMVRQWKFDVKVDVHVSSSLLPDSIYKRSTQKEAGDYFQFIRLDAVPIPLKEKSCEA